MSLQSQLLLVVSVLHNSIITLFGFFIPALSSVKAVVHKDSEAYHQWSTYWLILHLYLIILSPILHITLHPIFQIIAILWLSLPQYQGALVVYERIVNPWVDQYENKVDDAVEEAHRGLRRWLWSRLGGMTWMLMGEGGNLAMGIANVVILALHGRNNSSATMDVSPERNSTIPLAPRHSVKDALGERSSSVGDFGNQSFNPTNEFVNEFMSMLQQGLYVFANVNIYNEVTDINADDAKKHSQHALEGGFKISTFSFTQDVENGAFLISPAPTGPHDLDTDRIPQVRIPLGSLMSLRSNGSRGLILECHGAANNSATEFTHTTRAEIIMSDESDREILLGGLNACLPCIPSLKQN